MPALPPTATLWIALAALALAVRPALAIVVIDGSVQPAGPSGVFGNPPEGTYDDDGDGLNDFINIGGNRIFSDGTRFDDPQGLLPGVIAWNDEALWVDYDTTQNIIVGDAFSTGTLTINGGTALRYQHLVIGHASELSPFNTTLSFDPTTNPEQFDFTADLLTVETGAGGSGTVIITGPGSVYNNDPNLIPREFQTDLNIALDRRFDTPIYDLTDNVLVDSELAPGVEPTIRDETVGFDVFVGLTGSGILQIDNGGRIEIQDDLMVAVGDETVGAVIVDGFGSTLAAFGRSQLDENGLIVENETTSFVGGRGSGSLTVQNFGRAEFRNGLSIGAPTGEAATATDSIAQGAGQGSGVVRVTGFGSRMDVYAAEAVAGFEVVDSGGLPEVGGATPLVSHDLALAVGSLRDGSIAQPLNTADPDNQNLQPGTLVIADEATVNVLWDESYMTNLQDANAAVGPNGQVILRDGSLYVANRLIHDGDINGYGLIRARAIETSISSVISGGDPTAEYGVPSDPLRIVLLGDGSVPGPTSPAAFTHRGVIEGRVDMQVTGDVTNDGVIDMSGELVARSLSTMNGSLLRSNAATPGPLRVRLSSATQANNLPGMGSTAPAALENNGTIAGEIDLVATGGVINGSPVDAMDPPGNGGSIRASGVIQSGTLLNHRSGDIYVGAGQSLSILATATQSIIDARVVQDGANQGQADGTVDPNATFYQANLGSIRVDGGDLELGRVADFTPPTISTLVNHEQLFRNARYFNSTEGLVTGTIQVEDGAVRFRNGVYNTGVMAFTAGDSTVAGQVINAGPAEYIPAASPLSGVILVSGGQTTVTFEDNVYNDGVLSIGPNNNVVNFLKDLTIGPNGEVQIAENISTFGLSESSYITVAGTVDINGGSLSFAAADATSSALAAATLTDGFSQTIISSLELAAGSRFTAFDLPLLATGDFWNVVYDLADDEVRLEVVSSSAIGADFNDDGVVDQEDVDIWLMNVGVTMGASFLQGDADRDGDVDLTDYEFIADQIVTGVPVVIPAVAVPEPAAALLAAIALAGAARRRG
ncbi:hypothetical protein [Botrimarina sp.]|uniref:hypothetical protein n=1 Tax=Botrimarina sp. TaxID=2795802 RepID=UPI0032EC99A4